MLIEAKVLARTSSELVRDTDHIQRDLLSYRLLGDEISEAPYLTAMKSVE